MKNLPERTCVICNKTFTPKSIVNTSCSLECTNKRKAQRAFEKRCRKRMEDGKPPAKPRAPKQKHVITCMICGEEFISNRADKKTCSTECYQLIAERQKLESWEKLINRTPIPEWLSGLQTVEAARLRETVKRSEML